MLSDVWNENRTTASIYTRAGKNLRFLKKVFRFLGFLDFLSFFRFLGFNVYAQSYAEHWTQEYDQPKSYRPTRVD